MRFDAFAMPATLSVTESLKDAQAHGNREFLAVMLHTHACAVPHGRRKPNNVQSCRRIEPLSGWRD
jgi:hypothetical protein